jgi:glycosyltransferase involved in cell wall biosynthesis
MSARVQKILHAFIDFGVGGTQIGFVRLANHFGNRFRHIVISMNGDISCAGRLDRRVDCRVIPMLMRKSHGLSLANLVQARRTIQKSNADLLLTYNWGSIEWALANRWVPLCRHLHVETGFNLDEMNRPQKLRRIWFRQLAFAGGTSIIVPSRTLHRTATQTWGFHPDRVLYVPNGVDVEKFATGANPSTLPELQNRGCQLVVGTLSALRQDKRIDRLIRAVAALPSDLRACLVIAGDGPERPFLERLAIDVGIADRTLFAGDIPAPERVLGLFDIFALTSDSEQMPYALVEAMAAGLPVVATDVGDIRELVAPENAALIVPRTSDSALIGAISALARDATRRRALGYRNQEKARREFDASSMMKTYEALFAGTIQYGARMLPPNNG